MYQIGGKGRYALINPNEYCSEHHSVPVIKHISTRILLLVVVVIVAVVVVGLLLVVV